MVLGCSSESGEGPATGSGGNTSDASSGGGAGVSGGGGGWGASGGTDAGSGGSAGTDAGSGGSAGMDASQPCTTRITYGSGWIKPAGHAAQYDDASGEVTWDGSCAVDSSGNASATLSNGWKPFFSGKSCILALDYAGDCPQKPSTCGTRISYGPSWLPAPNHPASYDDVNGAVTWNGVCSGNQAQLSNGWTPTFSSGCDLAFRYTQCGGLYENPVVNTDCPDPGVTKVGDTYYMVCTPGYGYPIRSSKDLVHWKFEGPVFTAATRPAWAKDSFWAPEIHPVGGKFVVYFSARANATGTFAVGAAVADNVLGPYTDIGKPLKTEPAPGAIDASTIETGGKRYLLWKVDGNAVGQSTPIKIQELTADGLSLVGSAKTILSNTLAWEGALVEGPWMVKHGSYFYLFYSANGYASTKYAIGVARSTSVLGPFEKSGAPILTSAAGFAGPGHGSVLVGPSGDWVHVYHSWLAGKVGQSPGRLVLVDRIRWSGDWPTMLSAPSPRSAPLP